MTVHVQRVSGTAGPAAVEISSSGGNATPGADYLAVSQTASWSDGDAGERAVTVQLLQDTAVEGSETFQLRLSGATGATLGAVDVVTVTIVDDDQPPTDAGAFSFAQTEWVANEASGAIDIVVSRGGSTAGSAAVDLVAAGGSAVSGVDFSGLPARLSWGAGQGGPRTARVVLHDDALLEGEETIALALANPSNGASIGAPSTAAVRLTDDDLPGGAGALRLVSTSFSGLEGESVEVVIERIGGVEGAVSAAVETAPASATAGADYRGDRQTVRWGAGESGTRVARFALPDDDDIEGAESFRISLESPTGGALLTHPAVATAIVRDDDFLVTQEAEVAAGGASGRVAHRRDGRTAVAWQADDGAGDGVFARFYASSGRADGGSFRLHSSAAGDQRQPAIAFDAGGRLVSAWVSEAGSALRSDDGRVMVAASVGARLLARTWWTPEQAAGPELELAADPDDLRSVSVASDGSGRSWAAWEADGRIFARRFDAAGTLGPALELGRGDRPALDVAVTGEAAVVWRSGARLVLRRIDPSGAALPSIAVVETASLDSPDVALSADGGAVVVWSALHDLEDVFLRRYGRDGAPLGPARIATGASAGIQQRPRVESNARGDFAVVWEEPDRAGLGLRLFDAAGLGQGSALELDTSLSGGEAIEPEVSIGEDDAVSVLYRRLSVTGAPAGLFQRRVEAEILDPGCVSGSGRLCTHRGRFEVSAIWRDAAGGRGEATGVELGAETGYLWFFDPANVELVVKALDGCGVNDRFWVFAGGLTDLEVLLLVDDLESGHSQVYFNPRGAGFAPIRDASALSSCDVALGVHGGEAPAADPDAFGWPEEASPSSARVTSARVTSASVTAANPGGDVRVAQEASCRPDDRTLCLGAGRFQVRLDWSNAAGSGVGRPLGVTADTGAFWFFGPDNAEVVVKVLDACALNGHRWVFAGGLTDVGVEMTVVDKSNGRRRVYSSPQGMAFEPIRDVVAFPCS